MKNIWVVSSDEPIPFNNGKGRLMRAYLIAKTFADNAHNVTWITSDYLHYQKEYLEHDEDEIQLSDNFKIRLLHAKHAYKKNISLKRILYCMDLGRKLKKYMKAQKQKPDLIYVSWPLIESSYYSVKFAKENNIVSVVDVRDLWPDIFIQPLKKILKGVGKLVVDLLYKGKTAFTFKEATLAIGITPAFVNFALGKGRVKRKEDRAYYLSYDKDDDYEVLEKYNYLKDKFVVVFIGSIINRILNTEVLIQTIKLLKDKKNIHFTICGDGSYLEEFKKRVQDCDTVTFTGYVSKNDITNIMKNSNIGLIPYNNTTDFIDSIPNKMGEYLSEGLVVGTYLKGLSKRIVEENETGFYFDSPSSLTQKILEFNNDKEKYNRYTNNAKNLFNEEFNRPIVYNKLVKTCEKLIDEKM